MAQKPQWNLVPRQEDTHTKRPRRLRKGAETTLQQFLGQAFWVQEDLGADPKILLLARNDKKGTAVHYHLFDVQANQAGLLQETQQDASRAHANQAILGLEHGLHHGPAAQQAKQEG